MKLTSAVQVMMCLILLFVGGLRAQDPAYRQKEPLKLQEIAASIEQYRGRDVSMVLRLKHYDSVFERITFYDTKNHDIVFDISTREKKKALSRYMKNQHPGMEYTVFFTVSKIGNNGLLIGDLIKFIPVVAKKIP